MTLRVQPHDVRGGPESRSAAAGNGIFLCAPSPFFGALVVLCGQWPGRPLPGSGNHVAGDQVNANRILINYCYPLVEWLRTPV